MVTMELLFVITVPLAPTRGFPAPACIWYGYTFVRRESFPLTCWMRLCAAVAVSFVGAIPGFSLRSTRFGLAKLKYCIPHWYFVDWSHPATACWYGSVAQFGTALDAAGVKPGTYCRLPGTTTPGF